MPDENDDFCTTEWLLAVFHQEAWCPNWAEYKHRHVNWPPENKSLAVQILVKHIQDGGFTVNLDEAMVMKTVNMMILRPPKVQYTLDVLATLDATHPIFGKFYRPPQQAVEKPVAPKSTRVQDVMNLMEGIEPLPAKQRKKRGQISFMSRVERAQAQVNHF
jgi:hypothetical protein